MMKTTSRTWHRIAAHLVACAGLALLTACDDSVEVGGVGASVGLPSAFVNGKTDPADLGAGNVHWVGNPRW